MRPSPPMADEARAGFYPDFERGWRRAELAGRAAMLLVVGATLAGLLGGGPVSLWTRKVRIGGLEVEHAPVVRFGTPTGLTVRATAAPGQDRVAVTMPASLVQPGAREAVIQIGGMPVGGGLMRLWARLDDGPALRWSQVVLP